MGKFKWILAFALIALILSPVGMHSFFFCFLYGALLTFTLAWAQEDNDDDDDDAPKIETSLKGAKIPSKTDDEVVSR